jgi:hypothetical protein
VIIQIDKLAEPSFDNDKGKGADKNHGCNDSLVGSNKDCNAGQKKMSYEDDLTRKDDG